MAKAKSVVPYFVLDAAEKVGLSMKGGEGDQARSDYAGGSSYQHPEDWLVTG
jgi:hypothetical protein